jgi:hypothetical protein
MFGLKFASNDQHLTNDFYIKTITEIINNIKFILKKNSKKVDIIKNLHSTINNIKDNVMSNLGIKLGDAGFKSKWFKNEIIFLQINKLKN